MMTDKTDTPVVNCPTCDKPASMSSTNANRPFCCERCKLIDLGEWASESHRIAGETSLSEEDIDVDYSR